MQCKYTRVSFSLQEILRVVSIFLPKTRESQNKSHYRRSSVIRRLHKKTKHTHAGVIRMVPAEMDFYLVCIDNAKRCLFETNRAERGGAPGGTRTPISSLGGTCSIQLSYGNLLVSCGTGKCQEKL